MKVYKKGEIELEDLNLDKYTIGVYSITADKAYIVSQTNPALYKGYQLIWIKDGAQQGGGRVVGKNDSLKSFIEYLYENPDYSIEAFKDYEDALKWFIDVRKFKPGPGSRMDL